MKEIKELEIKVDKLYVTQYSFGGMQTRLVIQETDGTTLFDGDFEQASQLRDVLVKTLEDK